jgi:hypothetical protein
VLFGVFIILALLFSNLTLFDVTLSHPVRITLKVSAIAVGLVLAGI